MNQVKVIPAHPEDVTADWMTGVLRTAGMLKESRVASLRSEPVGSQGIIGRVIRFHLGFDFVEIGQPSSLIIKFPHQDPEMRKALQFMHVREILFYKSLGVNSGIPLPKYIYSEMAEDSADNLLLLEDLSDDTRPGCLVCGCTLAEAEAAIVHLAKFHAAWWKSERLDQYPWLKHKREWLESYTQEQFLIELEELLAKIRTEMPEFDCPPAFIQTATVLAKNFKRIKNFLYNAPVTMIHDDYHLDNMVFRDPEAGPEPVVIDWQCVAKGPGVSDLGYFIRFCLSPDQQNQAETGLLQTYYQILSDQGVKGYDFNRFLLDYQLSMLEPLERLVQVRGALNRSYLRGLEIFEAVLYRMKPILEHSRIAELIG